MEPELVEAITAINRVITTAALEHVISSISRQVVVMIRTDNTLYIDQRVSIAITIRCRPRLEINGNSRWII